MAAAVKSHHTVIVRSRFEAPVIMQHRGHDSCCAVGGSGDHLTARRIFLVHRQGEDVHPVERVHGTHRIGHELPVQFRGASAHAEHTGQQALSLEAPAYTILHDLPDAQKLCADLRIRVPSAFSRQHQLVNLESVGTPMFEQTISGIEFEWRLRAGR
jgi:hypothetical protein